MHYGNTNMGLEFLFMYLPKAGSSTFKHEQLGCIIMFVQLLARIMHYGNTNMGLEFLFMYLPKAGCSTFKLEYLG
jgi:hypothetical protein